MHGSSEVWLYHAGAPIRLKLSEDGETETHHLLGIDLAAGERPQLIVPPGWWQAAETLGEWTLVSCTVAPGFLFEVAKERLTDFLNLFGRWGADVTMIGRTLAEPRFRILDGGHALVDMDLESLRRLNKDALKAIAE